MVTPKGEFGFNLGGQRIHIQLGASAAEAAPPSRPLVDRSDEELQSQVAQVLAAIEALDVELRAIRGEQKRRRSV